MMVRSVESGWAKGAALVFALLAALVMSATASAAPTWLAPSALSPANETYVVPVRLAAGPDGTFVAAWTEYDPGGAKATVAVRPPGGAFAVQALNTEGDSGVDPVVAFDANGTAIAVWTEHIGPVDVIRASMRPPGGAFGAPQTISGGGQNAGSADVAFVDGVAVVSWVRFDGVAYRVQAAVKPAGTTFFAAPDDVGTTFGLGSRTDIALAANGVAVVAWQEPDGAAKTVRAAVRPAGGTFTTLPAFFSTTTDVSDHIDGPKAVIDPAGRATVLWAYYAAATNRHIIKSAARGTSGNFGAVDDVSDPAIDSGSGGYFDVAVDAENTAVAVWQGSVVQSAVRPSGGSFGPVSEISGPGVGASNPSVIMLPDGRALAGWAGASGGVSAIQAAERPKGGSFGAITDVASGAAAPALTSLNGPVLLAADPNGNAAAMWSSFRDLDPGPGTTYRYSVEAAGYDGAPPTITGATFPASLVTGAAGAFGVQATDVWSPVSLGWTFGDGGAATGASASHAYGAAGSFTATVTATDAVGNAASKSGTVTVTAPPTGGPGPGPGPGGGVINPPPPPAVVGAKLTLKVTKLRSGKSRLKTVVVTGIKSGDKVKLSCSGKGCTKKVRKTYISRGTKLDLSKSLKKVVLAPGAKLTITVTRAGAVGRVFRSTMVRGKSPRTTRLCLAPGATKATTCPKAG